MDDVTPARLAAATALRRLSHAIVGHQVDDAVFDEVTSAVERTLTR
ncbi:MAG: hypothetical protein QOG64_220 [Acidimicrobiaceae bacterium]|jgi:hypothetical protein|nr:hypothetical protein [Acidimicrobiaceae bacterium]